MPDLKSEHSVVLEFNVFHFQLLSLSNRVKVCLRTASRFWNCRIKLIWILHRFIGRYATFLVFTAEELNNDTDPSPNIVIVEIYADMGKFDLLLIK